MTHPKAIETITRVAAITMASAMAEPEVNLDRIAMWAERVQKEGATFAVFPEECITGSLNKSKRTFEEASKIVRHAAEISIPRLEQVCKRLNMTLAVGTIATAGDRFSNRVIVVGPDGFLGSYAKVHLPNATEREWFVAGDRVLVVKSQGWAFSVGICADLNYPEIFRAAARGGAEFILLAVGCSGDGSQQGAVASMREYSGLMRVCAVANGLYIFYADQSGPDRASLAFSMNLRGDVVDSCCGREGFIATDISRPAIVAARAGEDPTNLWHIRPEVYANTVVLDKGPGGGPTIETTRRGTSAR